MAASLDSKPSHKGIGHGMPKKFHILAGNNRFVCASIALPLGEMGCGRNDWSIPNSCIATQNSARCVVGLLIIVGLGTLPLTKDKA